MSGPALRLENVSKSFGRIQAVRDLSLEVQPGEMVGFLGPNGAGKSTTLYMLAGLVRPSCGRIELLGYDLRRAFKQAVARVGFLIEAPAFHGYLSGYRNLELIARLRPGATRKQIDEVLEAVGLHARRHDKAGTYSQGMKQRLGLAAALLGEPRLLVLDEPTSSLDPEGTRDILSLLRDRAGRQGWTVLLSSHLLYEVEEFCDRVFVIHKGRLLQSGRVAEILAPRADVVRVTFAGTVPARETLLAEAAIRAVEPVGETTLEITLAGRDTAWLNGHLVGAGYCVAAIGPRQRTLRDFFLDITGGRIDAIDDTAAGA